MTLGPRRRIPAIFVTVAIGVYWIAMCIGTHLPPESMVLRSLTLWDKFLHFLAFAGLVVLLAATEVAWRMSAAGDASEKSTGGWLARFFREPLPRLSYLFIWMVATAYGSIDETTQPTFGRSCDILDLLADSLGATCGLFAFWIAFQIGGRMTERDFTKIKP